MKTILFLGDSITDCGRSSEGGFGSGYVSMLARMLPDTYHIINRGYNGLTASGVLRQWRFFTTAYGTQATPLVSVLVGINDVGIVMNTGFSEEQALAYYKRDLRILASEVKESGSRLLMIEPFVFPRPSEYISWEPCVHHFCEIVRTVAAAYDSTLLSPAENFRAAAGRSSAGWGFVTTDGIHLAEEGHRILARLWIDAFFSTMN